MFGIYASVLNPLIPEFASFVTRFFFLINLFGFRTDLGLVFVVVFFFLEVFFVFFFSLRKEDFF